MARVLFGKRIDYLLAGIGFIVIVGGVSLSIIGWGSDDRLSRTTAYASNLKQLGLALEQYTQDYNHQWPGGADHWAGALYPYLKSQGVFVCPADKASLPPPTDNHIVSYAMNANIRHRATTALDSPSTTVSLIELDCGETIDVTGPERLSQYTNGDSTNTAWGGVRLGTTDEVENPTRHSQGVNVLACDGHVKEFQPSRISSGVDALAPTGKQDARHAAGATTVAKSPYELTFSEK